LKIISKKKHQLGMSHGKARNILVKNILWNFLVESNKIFCVRCRKEMTIDNFSIDHIIPWIDSDDPKGLYFDIKNIGFSHIKCNFSLRRNSSGEKHGRSKVSDDDIKEMFLLRYRDKLTYSEIAEKYPIGASQVGRIIRKEQRKLKLNLEG